MSDTSNKPIRRFLHLGQSVASQVRDRADRWGLKESEAIHQLIHLGLRISSDKEGRSTSNAAEIRQVRMLVTEILRVQVEALLYQRETAADAALLASKIDIDAKASLRKQKLTSLDAEVREMARPAIKTICERAANASKDAAAQ